jgi:hypothetical protein
MGTPSTLVTPRDGGLGGNVVLDGLSAKIGTASSGTANSPVYCASKQAAVDAFTSGPLVRAAIWHFERSQRPLLLVRGTGSTAGANGSVTQSGGGPVVTASGTPTDAFEIRIRITVGGAIGTSQFYYSTDGSTDLPSMVGPIATAASYAIPGTGATANLAAGTYVVDEVYSWDTAAPANTVANVQTASAALAALTQYVFEMVHVVGGGADAAASATMFAALDTLAASYELLARPLYFLMDHPVAATPAQILTAYASTFSRRVGLGIGTSEIIFPDGTKPTVPLSWSFAPKIMAAPLSVDIASMHPSEQDRPDLPGVLSISHDEFVTGGMTDQGFLAARTRMDVGGFYAANWKLRAPVGSDYRNGPIRRIADQVCRIGQAALAQYESSRVPVSPTTGQIFEEKAREIDKHVEAKLRAGIVDQNHASSATCRVSRTDNILSTETLTAEIDFVPPGYARTIRAYVSAKSPNVFAVAA